MIIQEYLQNQQQILSFFDEIIDRYKNELRDGAISTTNYSDLLINSNLILVDKHLMIVSKVYEGFKTKTNRSVLDREMTFCIIGEKNLNNFDNIDHIKYWIDFVCNYFMTYEN